MTALTAQQALEAIYASLQNDNADIDAHIANMKAALAAEGKKAEIAVDPARLAQNNRAGRKMMESYFKKRGLAVKFT